MQNFSDPSLWRVREQFNDIGKVRISFDEDNILPAVRIAKSVLPEFHDISVSVVLKKFRSSADGSFLSSRYEGRRVYDYFCEILSKGVDVERIVDSYISYLIFSVDEESAILIEDDNQCESIAKDLIARGATVDRVEA